MSVDATFLRISSLDDFHHQLQPRLDAVNAALAALSAGPGTQPPALGGFQDAQATADRHQALREQYGARLRHLRDALVAAQVATSAIAAAYRTSEALNHATFKDIGDTLRPVGEALDGSRTHG